VTTIGHEDLRLPQQQLDRHDLFYQGSDRKDFTDVSMLAAETDAFIAANPELTGLMQAVTDELLFRELSPGETYAAIAPFPPLTTIDGKFPSGSKGGGGVSENPYVGYQAALDREVKKQDPNKFIYRVSEGCYDMSDALFPGEPDDVGAHLALTAFDANTDPHNPTNPDDFPPPFALVLSRDLKYAAIVPRLNDARLAPVLQQQRAERIALYAIGVSESRRYRGGLLDKREATLMREIGDGLADPTLSTDDQAALRTVLGDKHLAILSGAYSEKIALFTQGEYPRPPHHLTMAHLVIAEAILATAQHDAVPEVEYLYRDNTIVPSSERYY
jgi:hypothetical protein